MTATQPDGQNVTPSCPLCKSAENVFVSRRNAAEAIIALPDLNTMKIIQTQLEVDAIQCVCDHCICLTCGIPFRKFKKIEKTKAVGNVEAQQQKLPQM